ncbi:MAG: PilZ domain-containing protein [Myxococcota bacterium]
MKSAIHDHRRSPRVRVARIRIGLQQADLTLEGNISSGGVGFEIPSAHRVHIGDPITVAMSIPELSEPVALSAMICHVQHRALVGRQYVGARFTGNDELVLNPLDRFVEESALLSTARPV